MNIQNNQNNTNNIEISCVKMNIILFKTSKLNCNIDILYLVSTIII